MEMLHMIPHHPEVITNLNFEKVSTMPLELRPGVILKSKEASKPKDGAHITSPTDYYRRKILSLPRWRNFTPSC